MTVEALPTVSHAGGSDSWRDMVAELNAALAAAQGEFPPITKSKKVKTQSYEYTYASLDAILAAVRPALSKHGLAVTQGVDGDVLRTELRHKGGAVIGFNWPLALPENPQQAGSKLTYWRRYALAALLGVAAEEDDDGQQAAAAPAKPKTRAAQGEVKMVTNAQHAKIAALVKSLDEAGVDIPADYPGCESWVQVLKQELEHVYGVSSRKELTAEQASTVITWLDTIDIPF